MTKYGEDWETPPVQTESIVEIATEQIVINLAQSRKRCDENQLDELAASIRQYGVLLPLVVYATDSGYVIVSGERRYRAARRAGLLRVPAVIRSYSEVEAEQIGLLENIQRVDLSPLEAARAYERIMKQTGWTQAELAEKIGKDRTVVSHFVRLLELPEEVKVMLDNGQLTVSHGRVLLSIPSELIVDWAKCVVAEGLTAKQLVDRANKSLHPKAKKAKQPPQYRLPKDHKKQAEGRMSGYLGLPSRIRDTGRGGVIEIAYKDTDELRQMVRVLSGRGGPSDTQNVQEDAGESNA